MQSALAWTDEDIERADRAWDEYQQAHDLRDRVGQTAGVDPETGRVWFGESIGDVAVQREAEGLSTPLFFYRVGYSTYYRKGRR
jgi:hypothetical protein